MRESPSATHRILRRPRVLPLQQVPNDLRLHDRSLYLQSPHSSKFLHASRAPSSLRVSLRVSLRMRAPSPMRVIRLIRAVPRLRHLPDRLLPRAALPRFLPRSSVLRGSLRLL